MDFLQIPITPNLTQTLPGGLMLFMPSETEVYNELLQNSSHLGVAVGTEQDIIRKLARQRRTKTTTVAHLKTYLHNLPKS